MAEQNDPSLAEAVTSFLSTLTPEQKQQSQQALNRFVHWYGGARLISELKGKEVAEYSDSVASQGGSGQKLEPVKDFLTFARKKGMLKTNLAAHLRLTRTRKSLQTKHHKEASHALTSEGHEALKLELEALKNERPRIAERLREAAADKDFRENAPLEAAREQQGHIEGRIRALEATLKGATVLDQGSSGTRTRVAIGSTVLLHDIGSGEHISYTLVSPHEANPSHGKLSIVSPTGKSLLNQEIGSIIEVSAPVGMLKYQIEDIHE